MSHPRSAIDGDSRGIEPCEERLALSASLAGDLLLEAIDFGTDAIDSPDTADGSDLLAQAEQLRITSGLDGGGQTVAVIDSGVAWDHVALGGGFGPGYRVVGGWDFAEGDADPYDDGPSGYHGSHVAGLLAGETDGFAGVAPGADIVALRVFDDLGAGQLQWIESSLQWVHENQDAFDSPITTVNLSVGAVLSEANRGEAMAMLEDELQLLREDQILVFAASGNLFGNESTADGVLYPASSPHVEAVSSIDSTGRLSEFAQRESGILATSGESIGSAVPDHVFGWDGRVDDFAELDGTSMATPQVAAASMLVRQSMIEQGLDPTADDILTRLRDSATQQVDPLTGDTYHTLDLNTAIGTPAPTEQSTVNGFDGSNENETMQLDLRDGIVLRAGDQTYRLDDGSAAPLVIEAGGGSDSLKIIGSDQAERLIMYPGSIADGVSQLSTNDYEIELRGFENLDFDGGGGRDRVTLYDTAGDDTLQSYPSHATLSGVGFQFNVEAVPRIYVHATAGGDDTAFLHDSASDDSLAVRPQFTSLRNEETFQSAFGFERVYAYATNGGNDRADLYDSAGDDTMSISANRSIISGDNYQVSARGFESIVGHAIAGGDDVARLYADEAASRWHVAADHVQWTGSDNAVRIARGFERTMAFEQYEPIELRPQSAVQPIRWLSDDPAGQAAREAEASRAVFDALGDE